MSQDRGADRAAVLLEAPGDEVERVLREERERLAEQEVLAILRNRNLTREAVKLILGHPPLLSAYAVKKALVTGRHTPSVDAQHLVPHLYWMDLMDAAVDMRVHPAVRHSCERRLLERLPELGLGERVTLARRGPRALLQALRAETEPRVVQALLQNRFLTELDVLAMAGGPRTPAAVLGAIHYSGKWGCRYEVRKTLILNPSTPLYIAQFNARFMRRNDLEDLAGSRSLAAAVRRTCESILAKKNPKSS
jgi:hypothetical protein